MNKKLSPERWAVIGLLILMSLVSIVLSSINLRGARTWHIAIDSVLIAAVVVLAIIDSRKQKRQRTTL